MHYLILQERARWRSVVEQWLNHNWDYLLFAGLMIGLLIGLECWMRRHLISIKLNRSILGHLPWVIIGLTAVLLCAGWFLTDSMEDQERQRMKQMLSGFGPTLAYEIQRMDHERIQLETPPDDASYLAVLQKMSAWLEVNPELSAIYTIREFADGLYVFIASPETDYDRNGLIEGDNEKLVPIGEVSHAESTQLIRAFQGNQTFEEDVSTERGTFVRAYVPLFAADGTQEAVLALEFNGVSYQDNLQLARMSTLGMLAVFFILIDGVYAILFFVTVEMVVRRHQAELRANEEVIKHQAYHDALTDLPNRSLFHERLTDALQQAKQNNTMLAVMFLDLDRFKNVNDSLGHAVGDLLLQAVAKQLRDSVRLGDTVARVGGDEFIILLPGLSKEDAAITVAEKVLRGFRRPVEIDGHELYIGPSIGISIYPKDGTDAETLIKNADTAMYRAKERGNVYQLYTSAMDTKVMERLTLESSLRKAIERDELLLHYQPQVHLRTGKMVGVEALVRWQHPELGLLSPEKFIPLAEETGLIIPLGDWVLRKACKQMKEWHDQGMKGLRVSVNISPKQFQKYDLVQSVLRILEETGLHASLLELELTESCLMQSPEQAADVLFQLKQMGVKLSIDDFGTGYSSLSHLKHFPIDVLKISQFFIWDLPTESDDQAIVTTLIALAHSLQLKVVAEGVETQEQLTFLDNQHCDEIQGYFFSPPVPADDVLQLYRQVYPQYAEQDYEDYSI